VATILRVAQASELNRITSFLAEHWREDHVFVKSPEILSWQHLDSKRDVLNFVLAEDSGVITGVLGFIPFRKFDDSLSENTIALAIWKVIENADAGTGVRLLKQLIAWEKPTTTLAIGLSDMVVPIYRALRFSTGVMEHFAIFHPNLALSQITGQSVNQSKTTAPQLETLGRSLDLEESLLLKVETMLRANTPEKSVTYYRERFERHPWFRYSIMVLGRDKNPELLLVLREVKVENSTLFRVVDVGGDMSILPQSAGVLLEFLKESYAEYVDLVMTGVDSSEMIRNGFSSTGVDANLMLPNYFDPFERHVVNVAYTVKSSVKDPASLHFHPADTDQDRPNS